MQDMSFTHPVCGIAGVKERLNALQLRPNKALGQNFLIDAAARQDMLKHMPVEHCPVLEIGPGLGALTEGLLERGASPLLAVDKDEAMIRLLNTDLAHNTRLITLHADILRLDYARVRESLGDAPLYVAGNLPYYITTPIAHWLLDSDLPISGMSLLVQAEAAERFWAAPGDSVYGPLAVAVQCMYHVEKGERLPPTAFYPRPEVLSCCVRLTRRDETDFTGFLQFLKAVFAMRRKTILNNLLAGGYDRPAATRLLEGADIPPNTRAQALPPDKLYALFVLTSR